MTRKSQIVSSASLKRSVEMFYDPGPGIEEQLLIICLINTKFANDCKTHDAQNTNRHLMRIENTKFTLDCWLFAKVKITLGDHARENTVIAAKIFALQEI